jgi:hypothetical protein
MRAEVRALSRTWKSLKIVKKINLVPGRGLLLGRFLEEIQWVRKTTLDLPAELPAARSVLGQALFLRA